MSFLNFLSQKKIPRWIFKTRCCLKQKLTKKKQYLKCHLRHTNLSFIKSTINSEILQIRDLFSLLSYLYDTYHWLKFQKNPWDKDEMIHKFCMNYFIKNMRSYSENIKLIGYLILGGIKFGNLKNECFERKSPKG